MRIKFEAEAIGSGDKLIEPSQALAIVVPATLLRPAAASAMLVPKLIADAGENASLRFLDFFTANLRNPNTRAAYAVAVRAFFSWLDGKRVAPLAADDRAAGARSRDHHEIRMSHVPVDGDHRLPPERRPARIRAADGRARERADYEALRSAQRPGHARSGGADRAVASHYRGGLEDGGCL
jgi:hypothetical protein